MTELCQACGYIDLGPEDAELSLCPVAAHHVQSPITKLSRHEQPSRNRTHALQAASCLNAAQMRALKQRV